MNNTFSSCDAKSKYEWAFENAEHGWFYYSCKSSSDRKSFYLIRDIMLSFRLGRGHLVPENARLSPDNYKTLTIEQKQTEFETKLVNVIFNLTGAEPVIKDVDKKRCIFKNKFCIS